MKPKFWIGTVLFESYKNPHRNYNSSRLKTLSQVIKKITDKTNGDGILIFPAGYLNTGIKEVKPNVYLPWIGDIKTILSKIKGRSILICLGIDGAQKKDKMALPPGDQLGFAIDKNGIIAMGRKFHPIYDERETINLAKSYLELEQDFPRIFELQGKKFYLAVCYDIFGIKHKSLNNPGVKSILNLVHKFTPRCRCSGEICICNATSGDVYFAKNGFAGASKQWRCSVYGSAIFQLRGIPGKWPAGVYWNQGNIHIKYWRYLDNKCPRPEKIWIKTFEGPTCINLFPS